MELATIHSFPGSQRCNHSYWLHCSRLHVPAQVLFRLVPLCPAFTYLLMELLGSEFTLSNTISLSGQVLCRVILLQANTHQIALFGWQLYTFLLHLALQLRVLLWSLQLACINDFTSCCFTLHSSGWPISRQINRPSQGYYPPPSLNQVELLLPMGINSVWKFTVQPIVKGTQSNYISCIYMYEH